MAVRYRIAGNGDWNSTTRWSTSSGGPGGASVPTQNDDVVFDSNSSGITWVDGKDDYPMRNLTIYSNTNAVLEREDSNQGVLAVYGDYYVERNIVEGERAINVNFVGGVSTTISGVPLASGLFSDEWQLYRDATQGFRKSGGAKVILLNDFVVNDISVNNYIVGDCLDTNGFRLYVIRLRGGFGETEDVGAPLSADITLLPYSSSRLITTLPAPIFTRPLIVQQGALLYPLDSHTTIFESDLVFEESSSGEPTIITASTSNTGLMSKDSGEVVARNAIITNSVVTGGATFRAPLSFGNTDGGNNTGWIFFTPPVDPIDLSRFDAISISENIRANVTRAASVRDTLAASEVVMRSTSRVAFALTPVAVSENISRTVQRNLPLGEALAVAENLSVSVTSSRVVAEALVIAESERASVGTILSHSEGINISELQARSMTTLARGTDTISISEHTSLDSGASRTVVSSVTIAESTTRTRDIFAAHIDDTSVAGGVVANLHHNVHSVETITQSESVSGQSLLVGSASDALSVSESLIVKTDIFLQVVEDTNISEFIFNGTESNYFIFAVSDLLVTSEISSVRHTRNTTTSTVLLSDVVTAISVETSALIAETLSVEGATVRARTIAHLLLTPLTIGENLAVFRSFTVDIEVQDTVLIEEPTRSLVESWARIVEEIVFEESHDSMIYYDPGILYDEIGMEEDSGIEAFSFGFQWASGRGRGSMGKSGRPSGTI